MDLIRLNKIWDRAARNGGSSPRRGDTALASLLRVHGMIMSGGIEHALSSLSPEQYKAGIEGYRYFGLLGAAIVLDQARITKDADLIHLTENYKTIIPNDSRLFHALGVKLIESPEDFCPLQS